MPLPLNHRENRRLSCLQSYAVFDTPAEDSFDEITRLVARICETPFALVNLVGENREWYKSRVGLEQTGAQREFSFCSVAIEQDNLLVVEDAGLDRRFAGAPQVQGKPHLRFYAGMPLITKEGCAIGTLAVMDIKPRKLTGLQEETLRVLSRQVVAQLERCRNEASLQRSLELHERMEQALSDSEALYRSLVESLPQSIYRKDRHGRYLYANKAFCATVARGYFEIVGKTDADLFPPEVARAFADDEARIYDTGRPLEALAELTPEAGRSFFQVVRIPVWDRHGELTGTQGIFWDVTQQKKTEEALRETEEKYRSIFENVVEGIYQTTPDGRYLAVNRMVAKIYGYESPAELMSAVKDIKFQIYVDPNRRGDFIGLMQEHEVISDFESQIRRKDGSIIWISENARCVRDSQGRLLYYEGTVEDITARKKTEDALRHSEYLYHSLVESLPQNIFRKDLQGRFTFGNERFCATVGLSLPEIIGRSDFDLFPAELARKYQRDDHRVMLSQQILEVVEAHQTSDLGKRYVQVVKAPLFDSNHEVIGIQGIFWDVTERKKIEEALRYERDLLRELLDNIPDRIYFKDSQSRFLKCGKALASLLGLANPEQAIGKTDYDFFTEEHARATYHDEQEIIRTGQPIIGKTEKETWQDGTQTWVLTTKMPFRNQDGVIIGTFGISKDITRLKRAEEALELARDAALESARLKSQFLATMSHEIRTPMNGILGMTSLLMDTDLTDEQWDFAETIYDSAETLLTIINDILDFSKIEAGKLSFEVIDFDLRDSVESTVEILAERAQAKGLELASWIPEEVPTLLRGDPVRLRQVLTNLIGNAIKFTRHGEVIVRVLKDDETENDITLRFTVTDTGIGIDQEAQSLIFQPFTQADGSTSRKYGGTGLGLAISKQLVELMQGQIGLKSAADQGSSFWFTVRLKKQPRQVHPRDLPDGELNGAPILLVDDNQSHRQILRDQLLAAQMDIKEAGNGEEALRVLERAEAENHTIRLAMIDLDMPGMDGLTLTKKIKAHPAVRDTRVVLMATLTHRVDPDELNAAGVDGCLVKPLRHSRLFECLATVLKGQCRQSPATSKHSAGHVLFGDLRPLAPGTIRILLAEDNPINQKVALRQLKKLGYSADPVRNGLEALAAAERHHYDIIFMDCQMPEMDGYETARRIRQREKEMAARGEQRPPAVIVAMTANVLAGDREDCLAAGMDDYLTKPVHLSQLSAVLGRVVQQIDGQGQSRVPAAGGERDSHLPPGLEFSGLEDDPEALQELIDLFLADTPRQISAIKEAVALDNSRQLKSAAHSLKGSARNLGAQRLADICAALEALGQNGQAAPASEQLAELEREFERVQAGLERKRTELSAR